MLTITEAAASKAKEILRAEGKDNWGLRIFIHGSGCCGPSYGLDLDEKAADGDETVERDGLRVFMDRDVCDSLSNKEIDYVKTPQGEGFIINSSEPPSCSSGCSSCG